MDITVLNPSCAGYHDGFVKDCFNMDLQIVQIDYIQKL